MAIAEPEVDPKSFKGMAGRFLSRSKTLLTHGLEVDIHEDVEVRAEGRGGGGRRDGGGQEVRACSPFTAHIRPPLNKLPRVFAE